MTKKKIIGLEKALEGVPPEDRDALRETVKELFEKAEAGPIGKVVIPLPDGTTTCPKCEKKLKHPHTMQLPPGIGGGGLAGQLVTCLECRPCDQFYMVKAVQ